MHPQIAPEVAQKRLDELMQLQSEISRQNNERYLNQEIEVLNEGRKSFNSLAHARCYLFSPLDSLLSGVSIHSRVRVVT